jgi:hypothetical protein
MDPRDFSSALISPSHKNMDAHVNDSVRVAVKSTEVLIGK